MQKACALCTHAYVCKTSYNHCCVSGCNELLWVLAVVTGQTLYIHTHTGYNTGKANYKSDWSGLVTSSPLQKKTQKKPKTTTREKKTQNKKCLVGHITGNPLGRFAIPLRSPWLRSSWQCWLLCFPILRPLLL